jgi:hypothetical protein
MSFTTHRILSSTLLIGFLISDNSGYSQSDTFARDAQHTAVFEAPAQRLNAIRWTTPIDTHYSGFAHYGAPVVTPSNTVLVPVKISSTGFLVRAFESATGRIKYTLTNDYIMAPIPTNGNTWIPVYQPAIANPPSGARLYYPGAGGTVYYIENIDSDTPGITPTTPRLSATPSSSTRQLLLTQTAMSSSVSGSNRLPPPRSVRRTAGSSGWTLPGTRRMSL